jgi:hypothetical protein
MSQLRTWPPVQKHEPLPAATVAPHPENPTNTTAKNSDSPGLLQVHSFRSSRKASRPDLRAIEAGMAFLAPGRPR